MKGKALTLAGDVRLALVGVPGGSFFMGSPTTEAGHEAEETEHRVILMRDFYIARALITQRQWVALMGVDTPGAAEADEPVTTVSWDDAQRFFARLAEVHAEGIVRLPTEAEWKYACRAGMQTPFANGDTEAHLVHTAWYAGNSEGKPHPVETKKPNAWGLYDMHGNVFEWWQDWESPYPTQEVTDPTGLPGGEKLILRGGCFKCPAPYCRAVNRYTAPPKCQAPNFGFRVVWASNDADLS